MTRVIVGNQLFQRAASLYIRYQAFGEPYDEDGEPCQSVEKYL